MRTRAARSRSQIRAAACPCTIAPRCAPFARRGRRTMAGSTVCAQRASAPRQQPPSSARRKTVTSARGMLRAKAFPARPWSWLLRVRTRPVRVWMMLAAGCIQSTWTAAACSLPRVGRPAFCYGTFAWAGACCGAMRRFTQRPAPQSTSTTASQRCSSLARSTVCCVCSTARWSRRTRSSSLPPATQAMPSCARGLSTRGALVKGGRTRTAWGGLTHSQSGI
mmetsp:Transcript_17451/g.44674  ORF Transcript_17451/g.44674 Transcript_17451/m.44674 type:complete len:222 (-) Transcript_17451:482-1147(-)